MRQYLQQATSGALIRSARQELRCQQLSHPKTPAVGLYVTICALSELVKMWSNQPPSCRYVITSAVRLAEMAVSTWRQASKQRKSVRLQAAVLMQACLESTHQDWVALRVAGQGVVEEPKRVGGV
jgi:hypothetical protein